MRHFFFPAEKQSTIISFANKAANKMFDACTRVCARVLLASCRAVI